MQLFADWLRPSPHAQQITRQKKTWFLAVCQRWRRCLQEVQWRSNVITRRTQYFHLMCFFEVSFTSCSHYCFVNQLLAPSIHPSWDQLEDAPPPSRPAALVWFCFTVNALTWQQELYVRPWREPPICGTWKDRRAGGPGYSRHSEKVTTRLFILLSEK